MDLSAARAEIALRAEARSLLRARLDHVETLVAGDATHLEPVELRGDPPLQRIGAEVLRDEAKENRTREILELMRNSKTLEEAVEKVKALLNK